MSVFTVDVKNQPGELARLCEVMAVGGVNLILSGMAQVLQGAGIGYTMRQALTIRLENQPGTGAATFRKLADAGVNTDLLLPVRVSDDLFFAVICVDDAIKARRALGVQVIGVGDFAL